MQTVRHPQSKLEQLSIIFHYLNNLELRRNFGLDVFEATDVSKAGKHSIQERSSQYQGLLRASGETHIDHLKVFMLPVRMVRDPRAI